jgi:hypothetical protein
MVECLRHHALCDSKQWLSYFYFAHHILSKLAQQIRFVVDHVWGTGGKLIDLRDQGDNQIPKLTGPMAGLELLAAHCQVRCFHEPSVVPWWSVWSHKLRSAHLEEFVTTPATTTTIFLLNC